MFAVSIEKNILGGNLSWIVMASLGVLGAYFASKSGVQVEDSESESGSSSSSDE